MKKTLEMERGQVEEKEEKKIVFEKRKKMEEK